MILLQRRFGGLVDFEALVLYVIRAGNLREIGGVRFRLIEDMSEFVVDRLEIGRLRIDGLGVQVVEVVERDLRPGLRPFPAPSLRWSCRHTSRPGRGFSGNRP